VGGSPSSSGADGKAVVVFNIGVQAQAKIGGTWKSINDAYTKVSGTWKKITAGYVKVGGAWKALFNSGIEFTETAAGFGDAQGGSSSGTPGSGGGGGGGRVICTWLNLNDMFSSEDLQTDTEFSVKYLGKTLKIGYWFWAVPFVRYLMRAHKRQNTWDRIVIEATRMFAQARANEIAYKMGKRHRPDWTGKLARFFGEGLCWTVGLIVRPFVEKKFAQWLKIYDNNLS